jgi:ubiquinone/menaquinone biosynthesis C-methylase UbiE
MGWVLRGFFTFRQNASPRVIYTRHMSLPTITRFVHPDIVSTHFHFREGDRVADFGAGSGRFLKALSRAVGSEGRVYACEIRKNLIEMMAAEAIEWRLPNVETIWADLVDVGSTKLKDGILDGGVLINTLFQIEDKEDALREIARVTRKGGKLFIVDWTESFSGLGPHPDHVVTGGDARALAEQSGFRFERDFPAGEHHYGLAFKKE